MGYSLGGFVLQAADGATGCGITAWHFASGRVSDIDVAGTTLVAVGRRIPGSAQRVLFVSETAGPEQVCSLLDVFEGRLGFCWGGLVRRPDEELGSFRMPITFDGFTIDVHGRLRMVLNGPLAEIWADVPELDLSWRARQCQAARARFLVED